MTINTLDQPTDDTLVGNDSNGNSNTTSWEDLEIELDEEKRNTFFPSRTYDNVRNLVAAGVPILLTIRFAYLLVGTGGSGAIFGVSDEMDDFICDMLDLVAEVFHGGGTDECVEYEEVPGHRTVCVEDDTTEG